MQSVDDVAEDARLASLCIMSRSSTISYCGRLNLWTREEERATSEGEHLNLWTREEERATSEGEHLNLWTREEERATSEGKQTEVFIAWLDHQHMLWDHLITVGTSVDAVGPSDHSSSIRGCCGTRLITVRASEVAVGPSDHSSSI